MVQKVDPFNTFQFDESPGKQTITAQQNKCYERRIQCVIAAQEKQKTVYERRACMTRKAFMKG